MAQAPLTPTQIAEVHAALDKHGGHQLKAAKELGLNPGTFKSRMRVANATDTAEMTGQHSDRTIYHLKKQLSEATGQLKKQHDLLISEGEARRIMGTLSAAEAHPPAWLISAKPRQRGQSPEVPVLMIADAHAGSVVRKEEMDNANEFNKDILRKRLWRIVESAMKLATEYGTGNYPGLVLAILGDMVEGSIHEEGSPTDDMEPLPSALYVFDLLVGVIDHLLERFGKLYIPMVSGNHGRTTPKPQFHRYVFKNYDWLIAQMLTRHFAGNKHIVFDVRPSNNVNFRIWRTRFRAEHGDMLGTAGGDGIIGAIGPIVRGEFKTQRQASAIMGDYDHLIMGHWHHPLWLPRAFVGNTLKGFDPYAKNKLKVPPSPPSQSMFYVHPEYGVTSRWELFANEKKHQVERAPWVTVLDRNAA